MSELFIAKLFENPREFFTLAILVIFSISTHEFFHAYAALRQGDSTAADAGHLTLNPLRQMGVFSLVMLAILGIAWGQVPVNPSRMRGRYGPALVAAAGPFANFLLWIVFLLLTMLTLHLGGAEQRFASTMLFQASALNLVLCVLNLLPVPGLDGFAVLTNLVPKISLNPRSEFVKGSMLVLILVLFTQIKWLFWGAYWLSGQALELIFHN